MIFLSRPRVLQRSEVARNGWFFLLISFFSIFSYSVVYFWSLQRAASSPVPFSDYRIDLPEGVTVVTVSDPRHGAKPIAQLTVERRGDQILGVPRRVVRIPPRELVSEDDAAFFRREMFGLFPMQASVWDKANAIREWLARLPHRISVPGLATRHAREAYLQMLAGEPVLCANLAEIYVAACQAAGLAARTVGMSLLVRNGDFGRDTHVGAEVWIPELGGWVYQDPTFNCYWEVDGKPASALELHEALLAKRPIELRPRGREISGLIDQTTIDPRLYFRYIYYEYKIGGTVLHFADPRLEPAHLSDPNWIQTDDPEAIRRLDLEGNVVVDQRGEIAPGIFVQIIRGGLFVRDRRQGVRGIRVRSSSGPVKACAYEHQRAAELGVFAGRNYVSNGSFHQLGESGALAEGWSISGPVEGMAALGGQGLAGRAGARLWQRVSVEPGKSYLLYAKVNVPANRVRWIFSEPGNERESAVGECEPERISEIVSDVITSRNGQLEVAFELPEGGALRVLEVIVSEVPRFDHPVGEETAEAGPRERRIASRLARRPSR